MEDGNHWELSRYYEDFYDFQIALLTEFPAEAGNAGPGQKRTLPYMPGPVSYVTDAITEGRLHNLDAYVKNLLGQPEHISRCNLVRQFFAPREGDYQVQAHEVDEGNNRYSEGSRQSSGGSQANGASRQSSRNNLNGNGYGGMSGGQQGSGGQWGGQQQQQQQQPQQPQQLKVKMYFNRDLIAIRVPADIAYGQLCEKIRERLKITTAEQMQLSYEERKGNKQRLSNDDELDYALQQSEKLVLHVEVV